MNIKEMLSKPKEVGANRRIIFMTHSRSNRGSLFYTLWSDHKTELLFVKDNK